MKTPGELQKLLRAAERAKDPARDRGHVVNPAGPIYDVKAGGHTIEWTDSLEAAQSAYRHSHCRDRVIYRMINAVKVPIQVGP